MTETDVNNVKSAFAKAADAHGNARVHFDRVARILEDSVGKQHDRWKEWDRLHREFEETAKTSSQEANSCATFLEDRALVLSLQSAVPPMEMRQCITIFMEEVPGHKRAAENLDSEFSKLKDAVLNFPDAILDSPNAFVNPVNHSKPKGFWQRIKEKIKSLCTLIYQARWLKILWSFVARVDSCSFSDETRTGWRSESTDPEKQPLLSEEKPTLAQDSIREHCKEIAKDATLFRDLWILVGSQTEQLHERFKRARGMSQTLRNLILNDAERTSRELIQGLRDYAQRIGRSAMVE